MYFQELPYQGSTTYTQTVAPIVQISIEKVSVEVKPELVCSMPVAPGQNGRWTSSKTWPLDLG